MLGCTLDSFLSGVRVMDNLVGEAALCLCVTQCSIIRMYY